MDARNIPLTRSKMVHRCVYFHILIFGTMVHLYATSILLIIFFSPNPRLSYIRDKTGLQIDVPIQSIWGVRAIVMAIICIVSTISYYGWRGYLKLQFGATIFYFIVHALVTINLVFRLFSVYSIINLASCTLLVLVTAFTLLFALEIESNKRI